MLIKPLEPTQEMLDAGVEQLLQEIPGIEDGVDEERLQDAICFVWQAMWAAG